MVMTSKGTRSPPSPPPGTVTVIIHPDATRRFSLSISLPVLRNHSRLHNPLRRSSHRSLARSRTREVSRRLVDDDNDDDRRETGESPSCRSFALVIPLLLISSSDIRGKQAGMKEVPLKLRYCTRRSYLQRISLYTSSVGYEVASYDYGVDIYTY